MLNLLATKPLVIAVGALLLTNAIAAWKIADQYEELGAAQKECEYLRQLDALTVTATTEQLSSESLRTELQDVKRLNKKSEAATRQVAKRQETTDELLKDYQRALDAARKTDATLDSVLSNDVTQRLRDVEGAYHNRAARSHQD